MREESEEEKKQEEESNVNRVEDSSPLPGNYFYKIKKELLGILKNLPLLSHQTSSPSLFSTPHSIETAKDFRQLLNALGEKEKSIYKYINDELAKLDKPSVKQEHKNFTDEQTKILTAAKNQLTNVKKCILVLRNLNKLLLHYTDLLLSYSSRAILTIRERIVIESKPPSMARFPEGTSEEKKQSALEQETLFLAEMSKSVLLALMKAELTPEGKQFIQTLGQNLKNRKHTIKIVSSLNPSSASFLASATELEAQGIIDQKDINWSNDIHSRALAVKKNTGGSSQICFQVWTDNPKDFNDYGFLIFSMAKDLTPFIEGNISGSFSINEKGDLFYTPFHIEMLHELIHVLDNSLGINLFNTEILTKDEEDLWKDAEEYWAIKGAAMSENTFNASISIPNRHGHQGVHADILTMEDKPQLVLKRSSNT